MAANSKERNVILYLVLTKVSWLNNGRTVGRGVSYVVCAVPCRGNIESQIVLCELIRQLEVSSVRELQWDILQLAGMWCREDRIWGIYGVGSHYQARTGEDTADWEELVLAVINYIVSELATAL
jgi:hypothetical protein